VSYSEEPITDLLYGLDVRPPLRETLFVDLTATSSLPSSALGGATLILFGMVAASGIRILSQVRMNRRNTVILATSGERQ
jgi:hypothetical protein